jgi:hypothetical protein
VAILAVTLIGSAGGQPIVNHGISFTKGCASPTQVGQPYSCTYTIRNTVDDAQDTLTINGLVDVVHSAGGNVNSGNVFSSLQFVIGAGAPTCTGGSGNGSPGSPFTGATLCTLPFGSQLNVQPFSFYTVQAADFNLPGHALTDSAELTWHDLCNDPAGTGNSNCNANPPPVGAGSQSIVTGLPSTTSTTIHNAAHAAVLTVPVGTTVHDFVEVSGGPGNPIPTGSVTVDWFLNGTCTGTPDSTSASVPLVGGSVDVTGFAFTVNTPGFRGFKAHYTPDAASPYQASDGPCEPLQVVDARISITPNGTNPVGTTHTFTGHVEVNDGTGWANAPAGTSISFAINSGPGSFTTTNPCTTVNGSGTCTITLTSPTVGTTVVSASTTVSVGGIALTRSTDGTGGNSGPATKVWVGARIQIEPNATNEVGDPHTFTVTVQTDSGSGFVAAPGAAVTVTLTNSNGAVANPAGPFNGTTNASGQFQVTFTSQTAGQVTGTATATVTIGGQPVVVSTNGVAPNSGPAVKTFVDARISITPNGMNPVGAAHVFTGHVEVNLGNGAGFVNAPAGTQISFSIASGPGSISGSPCATVGATGSCTASLTSATPGTTVVNATTNVTVSGVPLTRTTNGSAGNSGPATKLWSDAAVRTDIHTPTHVVITTAQPGDVVHDKVFVTKAAGTPAAVPAPTGNVTFHRYSTIDCSGPAVDETVALAPDGTAETSSFTVTADMSYRADYLGDALYPARSGACEPLQVKTSICPFCPPPPCPAFPVFPGQPGPGGPCSLSVLETETKGWVIEVTVMNTSTGPKTLTGLSINWPAAVNGGLKQVILDGVLYSGPTITGGSALLLEAQLGSAAFRTIAVGQSEKLRLIFEKPVSTNKALYSAKLEFGTGCEVTFLP